MITIGYLRISSEQQNLWQQRHLVLEYANQHQLHVNHFIEVEISSRKSQRDR